MEAASRRQSTVSRHAPAPAEEVPPLPVITGPTSLERQAVALEPGAASSGGDDTTDGGPSAPTSSNENHGSLPIPARGGRTIGASGTDDSLSNAQTPMNETFFSTLADNLHETLRTDFGSPPDEAEEAREARSDVVMNHGSGDRDADHDGDREEPMFT